MKITILLSCYAVISQRNGVLLAIFA